MIYKKVKITIDCLNIRKKAVDTENIKGEVYRMSGELLKQLSGNDVIFKKTGNVRFENLDTKSMQLQRTDKNNPHELRNRIASLIASGISSKMTYLKRKE